MVKNRLGGLSEVEFVISGKKGAKIQEEGKEKKKYSTAYFGDESTVGSPVECRKIVVKLKDHCTVQTIIYFKKIYIYYYVYTQL